MLTFKDLIITADNAQIEELVDKLTNRISGYSQWQRKKDKENRALGFKKVYAFHREEGDKLAGAALSIFPKDEGYSWYIPNVVPIKNGQFTHREYNEILTEFYDLLVKPLSDELNIEVKITSGDVTPSDLLGKEAARALSMFSDCANKSTGSSHPCDRKRWLSFLYKACMLEEFIDVGLLEKLLIEQGWDEVGAEKLAIQFEFGRDLIDFIKENA